MLRDTDILQESNNQDKRKTKNSFLDIYEKMQCTSTQWQRNDAIRVSSFPTFLPTRGQVVSKLTPLEPDIPQA